MRCFVGGVLALVVAAQADAQPFEGTVFMSPNVITAADPSTLVGIEYTGRGERLIFDRREGWITVDAYLFEAQHAGAVVDVVEWQINPEFGSVDAARGPVDTYAPMFGRLPAVIVSKVLEVHVSRGEELWGATVGGDFDDAIIIHTGQGEEYLAGGFAEEVMFHEAAHTSLDVAHANTPGWREAQRADGGFISTYARDNPDREDIAESILPYFAVRVHPGRIPPRDRALIEEAIPNRLAYFDAQGFNWSPYMPTVPALPLVGTVTLGLLLHICSSRCRRWPRGRRGGLMGRRSG